MTKSLLIRTFVNFVAIVAAGLSADAAEIVMKAKTDSAGSLILLGDVAAVKSTDSKLKAKLERIELFPAPARGGTRTLHARHISELLRLHGVDLTEIGFTGSKTTRVHTNQQSAARPAVHPASAARSIPKILPQAVVAVRLLQRGDIIRQADVKLQTIEKLPRGVSTAPQLDEVVGQEVLRGFAMGQPIDKRQLRKPLLVRRGEVIRVKARAAGVQVLTTARATEQGALGDIIVVQSLENREKYAAHITGLQQAEVYAAAVTATDTRQNRRVPRRPIPITEK
jgi:flagella basal body P-ring formation protein FlgA